jgi:hypothetical protein
MEAFSLNNSEKKINTIFQKFPTTEDGIQDLVSWLNDINPSICIVEGRGSIWAKVFSAISRNNIKGIVVNPSYLKTLEARKPDIPCSMWLATIGRVGKMRFSFASSLDLTQLRSISRLWLKTYKNLKLSKKWLFVYFKKAGVSDFALDDNVIKLLVDSVIYGITPVEALFFSKTRKKITSDSLGDLLSMTNDLVVHSLIQGKPPLSFWNFGKVIAESSSDDSINDKLKFATYEMLPCIQGLRSYALNLEIELLQAASPYQNTITLLKGVPGVTKILAAALIAEIGVDMTKYESVEHLIALAGLTENDEESQKTDVKGVFQLNGDSITLKSSKKKLKRHLPPKALAPLNFHQDTQRKKGSKSKDEDILKTIMSKGKKLFPSVKSENNFYVRHIMRRITQNAIRQAQGLEKLKDTLGIDFKSPIALATYLLEIIHDILVSKKPYPAIKAKKVDA